MKNAKCGSRVGSPVNSWIFTPSQIHILNTQKKEAVDLTLSLLDCQHTINLSSHWGPRYTIALLSILLDWSNGG